MPCFDPFSHRGNFLRFILRALVTICLSSSLHGQTGGYFGYFRYIETSTEITIDDYQTNQGGSVTVPSTINGKPVTKIDRATFFGCKLITSITLPTSIRFLGYSAFGNCSSLTSFTIPSGVGTIEGNIFSGCSNLSSITVSSQNSQFSSLDGLLYNKSRTDLIACPEYKSGDIVLPTTLSRILTSSVTNCTRIRTVSIPASVTSMLSDFSYCPSLTSITVDTANPSFSSSQGMLFNKDMSVLLRCPGGKTGQAVVSEGTTVASGAFVSATSVEEVVLPASTTSIVDNMFYDCNRLRKFNIPESVTSIGKSAFARCFALEEVEIFDTVTSIGDHAFYGCSSLTRVRLPSHLTAIGKSWFYHCESLHDIIIPEGVVTIDEGAFSNSGLTHVIIPEAVQTIGKSAFFFTGLTSVRIPAAVQSIGTIAFSACPNLREIEVVAENGFFRSLDGVLFSKDLSMLIQCPAGKWGKITVPESVTSIPMNAFSNCAGVTAIRFMGNAPSWGGSGGINLQVLYFEGRTGFGTATWNGIAAINDGQPTQAGSWLVAHDLPYDRDLSTDLDGSGIPLLLAYALDLDPQMNPVASMPQALIHQESFSLTYFGGRSDCVYLPQWSGDLSEWSAEGITVSEADANGYRTAICPFGGGTRLMRLKVSQIGLP